MQSININEECSICFSAFHEKGKQIEEIKMIRGCKHFFHEICITN